MHHVRYNGGDLAMASQGQVTSEVKTDKTIRLPEFDGTGDVKGFMRYFDFQCNKLYFGHPVPDEQKKTYLFS